MSQDHRPNRRRPYALRMAGDTRPRYRQVADDIARRIADGEYPSGSKLPGRTKLADELSASVGTVEKALRDLADDGLLTAVHGSGTYVTGTVRKARKSDHDLLIDLAERMTRLEKHLGIG